MVGFCVIFSGLEINCKGNLMFQTRRINLSTKDSSERVIRRNTTKILNCTWSLNSLGYWLVLANNQFLYRWL